MLFQHLADCLAIVGEFRWYLTGRFPVICIPELAKRALGDGPLYRAFLLGEADDESVVPPGSYPPGGLAPERVGAAFGAGFTQELCQKRLQLCLATSDSNVWNFVVYPLLCIPLYWLIISVGRKSR